MYQKIYFSPYLVNFLKDMGNMAKIWRSVSRGHEEVGSNLTGLPDEIVF